MNEQTRYRITGSIFLAALAIIFLPMLFDGAGVESPVIPPMESDAQIQSSDISSSTIRRFSPESFAKAEALDKQVTDLEARARVGEVAFTPAESDSKSDSWGVQLGSFNSEQNAQQLREKLEQDGHHAVLSRANKDGQLITRVAVGPVIRESEAIKLRDDFSKTYQVEAIIVRFGHK